MLRPTRLLVAALVLLAGVPASGRAQRLKLDVGVKELQRRAVADSNDAVAHYNLALGYWSESKWDSAGAQLTQATALDPRLAPAHLALAYLPFARKSNLMEKVLEGETPPEWRDSVRASDRRYRLAFMIDPLVDLRIMAAVIPGRSPLWDTSPELASQYDFWLQGFDEFREGRYDGAYLRLDRVVTAISMKRGKVARVPDGVLWYRGLAAAHLERWQDAISDFGILLEHAEETVRADSLLYRPLVGNDYRMMLAYANQRWGEVDKAAQLYRAALERDLGLYTAHVRLAEVLELMGRMDEALLERQRAIDAAPDDPTLLFDLGLTRVKAGRLAEAESALEQATKALPRDARPWYVLGQVRLKLGKKEQGRADLERFLALAPSRFAGQIALARRTLKTLE